VSSWTNINRSHWDERVAPHAASPDYALDRFASDPNHLSDVVLADRPWRLPHSYTLQAVRK